MMAQRGRTAVVEYDPDPETFAGHVIDLRDRICFEGSSVEELKNSMQAAVDACVECCEERGKRPERPFSGRVNVRFGPSLHRRVAVAAAVGGKSMTEWMAELVISRPATSGGVNAERGAPVVGEWVGSPPVGCLSR